MKLLGLLLQGFVIACFAQCHVRLTPKRRQGLVCGQRGQIRNLQEAIFGNFTVSHEQYCKNACFRYQNCAAISYADQTGECNLLSQQISKSSFEEDSTSGIKFFNSVCFKFGSDGCDVAMNPSFDGPPASGFPASAYLPLSSEVQIVPWSVSSYYADNVTHAYLATLDNLPDGSTPSPSGGNFAVFLVNGNYQPGLSQAFSLIQNVTYDISFEYSAFNYTGPDQEVDLSLVAFCAGYPTQINADYRATVNAENADGTWYTYTSSLVAPNGNFLCGIQTIPNAMGSLVSIGIDNFELKRSS